MFPSTFLAAFYHGGGLVGLLSLLEQQKLQLAGNTFFVFVFVCLMDDDGL